MLTTRIAWLLSTGQVGPSGVLAVTFTNKAAKEMLTRLSALVPVNVRSMWIGTFHGLCNRFTHALARGWPAADVHHHGYQDQVSLIKRILKAHNIDDEKFPAKQMAWFIGSAKEEGLRPNAVEAFDDYTRKQVEIYQLYEATCQREGVVDFAERLLRSYEVLGKFESCASTTTPASGTSWSTNSRTPIRCNTNGCVCSQAANGGASGGR